MDATRLLGSRYAFVDVETTGLDPICGGVVEVGVVLVERARVSAAFETLVNPGMPIPHYATAVHGISDADVAGAPTISQITPFVHALCRDATIVAHNAAFDLSFLSFLRDHRVACSWRLAARTVPEAPNHKNQTLRRFFKITDPLLDGRAAHRALADAIVTRHVFFACLRRYLARGGVDSLHALLDFLATPQRVARARVPT
ncbi:MAG: DNA polymerase III subunit epsilon [Candidatus Meridianibacter frigidus]|nr:MAG: DNA polymerase III subunit epsilon [Candidatus Eremiobacteraeota bacterium]